MAYNIFLSDEQLFTDQTFIKLNFDWITKKLYRKTKIKVFEAYEKVILL